MTHVRPSIPSDCSYIAAKLRDADRAELGLYDITPEEALSKGFSDSLQPLTVVSEGMPCAMFGVSPQRNRQGCVWLLGTDLIFTAKVPFLRQSELWLGHCCRPFDAVGNWVDSRNTKHVKWLKWLGFEITSQAIMKNTPILYHHLRTKP